MRKPLAPLHLKINADSKIRIRGYKNSLCHTLRGGLCKTFAYRQIAYQQVVVLGLHNSPEQTAQIRKITR